MDSRRAQNVEDHAFAAAVSEEHARFVPDPERDARWAAWQAENAEAIASWNAFIEQDGLPLERYRSF